MAIQIRRTRTPNHAPTGLESGQLAVEMASDPPRLWCGVPASIDPSGRVRIDRPGGTLGAGAFKTGDTKLTLRTVAKPGWIMLDDGTIGDAESGATTRAHDDCRNLFYALWGFTHLEVLPARGADPVEDWEAHKQVRLPRQLGRAVIGAGQGAGLTDRKLGYWYGEESHYPTLAEMVQHTHSPYDPTHTHGGYRANVIVWAGGLAYSDYGNPVYNAHYFGGWWTYFIAGGAGTGHQTNAQGSSQPFNVMQPSTAWNMMMKL